ncbi:DUF4426 domain-containing protein [Luteimonas aestuarii]|nr:DUF4426 domain-containing protein [Luteimonas aestuarii]
MRGRTLLTAATATLLLAACGGRPASQDEIAAQMNAAREPAEVQSGDLRLQASIAPTSSLNDAIAARYGVQRNARTVLLLVGARRVDGNVEASLPATLQVGVRDLRGVRRPVGMREVRSDGFIDYVGEVRVAPPDTLTFDILADAGEAGAARLEFTREVFRP